MKRTLTRLLFLLFSSLAQAEPSLTLTGRYEYGADTETFEMLVGKVCFYPNTSSAKLLPRPTSDKRLAWFCFNNTTQAKKLLGLSVKQQQTR